MVYQVRWSHEALSDVEEIAQFIARDSSRYAGIVVEKILEATRQLEQFPRAGRKVPELNEEAIHHSPIHGSKSDKSVKLSTRR